MKLHKLNQQGVSHYILPVLVVAVVALIGFKVLLGSHADTPTINVTTAATTTPSGAIEGPFLSQIDNASNAVDHTYTTTGDTTATTTDTFAYSDANDTQTVSVVQPGQTLAYRGSDTAGTEWNGTIKRICYVVKVPYVSGQTKSATIQIADIDIYKTVTVKGAGVYSTYCVDDGRTVGPVTNALGWSVKNLSTSNSQVNVFQKITYVKS